MDRSILAVAILFGIPPAIGVGLATLRVTGGEAGLLAIIASVATGVGVAAFVIFMATYGSADPPPSHDV